jgi:hypothetical protein
MKQRNKDDIQQQVADLKFKVNTTPWWLGKSIYVRMLKKANLELNNWSNPNHRLNLCYAHRQEQNHSHYSSHNCDHCKLQHKSGIH